MSISPELMLQVKRLAKHYPLPAYATPGAACIDLVAAIPRPIVIYQGDLHDIPSGIQVSFPVGYVLKLFCRSGNARKHRLRLVNGTGIIDSDYRGEIVVSLERGYSSANNAPDRVTINPGDRIAQAMLVHVPQMKIVEVEELSDTLRGAGGFGSTGSGQQNATNAALADLAKDEDPAAAAITAATQLGFLRGRD
jgi:dUTP pyrophosphatase